MRSLRSWRSGAPSSGPGTPAKACGRSRRSASRPIRANDASVEVDLDPGPHPERVAGGEVDVVPRLYQVERLLRRMPGATLGMAELAAQPGVVDELGLAPVGVREVQERERGFDVPPAVAGEQVEQEVAARRDAAIRIRRAIVEKAAPEGHGEAVGETGGEAAVHEQRRR